METGTNDREYRSSREELSRARGRGVALGLSLVVAAAIDASDHDPDKNVARSDGDGNV
jgi:hypothetical protein